MKKVIGYTTGVYDMFHIGHLNILQRAREQYHFDKMFVGSDWEGTPQWKKFEEQFKPLGVEIVYLPHTDGISSTELTNLIKNMLDVSTEKIDQ